MAGKKETLASKAAKQNRNQNQDNPLSANLISAFHKTWNHSVSNIFSEV
jgi:hypothetical protein